MNGLIEKDIISEMSCGTNFAYLLKDSSDFLSTEYKVLQSQTNSGFVKCVKDLYNGKVQLYYCTENYKSLASILLGLDPDNFMTISSNLISNIIEVKNNGFLSCQNIDISLDKIFVDINTYRVGLIYLPISNHIYDDYYDFENELRTGLVKLISNTPSLSSIKTIKFASELSNGRLSLDDLKTGLKGGKIETQFNNQAAVSRNKRVTLTTLNSSTRVEINVDKDNFVIGKNASAVDGVVSFNKMISRIHCRINKIGQDVTITDLKSANGTFVNGIRLEPNEPHLIKNRDIIKLANSDFQVIID